MARSAIPYVDKGWPVVTGCSHSHIGCLHCYAARLAATRLKHLPQYKGLATREAGKYRWTGEMRLNSDILDKPLHWKKPQKVFVAQTSDLFHKDVPFDYIDKVFGVMALCPQHTFLVFTKRPWRMADYVGGRLMHREYRNASVFARAFEIAEASNCVPDGSTWGEAYERGWSKFRWPLPNVWLYTSVSDQDTADENIPHLLRCPAAVLGISYEPVLGPLEMRLYRPALESLVAAVAGRPASHIENPTPPVNHVIIGCESGSGRRPCELEWIESAVKQCQAAGVAVYVKQMEIDGKVCLDVKQFPKHLRLRETPKGE